MKTSKLSKCPVASLGAVSDRIIATTEEAAIPEVTASPTFATLKTCSDAYTDGIKKRLYSGLTAEMIEIDRTRDVLNRNMDDYVVTQLVSPLEPMRQAAQRVHAVSDRFPGIETLPYGEESKLIRKKVAELRDANLAPSITLLNLTPWVDALEDANEKFETKILERGDDIVSLREVQSASSQRKELEKAIHSFFELVHALVVIQNTEVLKTFEKRLFERVEAVIVPMGRTANPETKQPS